MIFNYIAYNDKGEVIKGNISADDEKTALKLIKNQKLILSNIKKQRDALKLNISLLSKVGIRDKIIFTKELAIMSKAGLSIIDALSSIAEEVEKPKFKKAILDIAQSIKGGESLSKSMAKYPDIFPSLYISVIKSGEESGKLDNVLLNLSEQMEKDHELISKVKSAMTYPILILGTLVGVAALILIFVMPQLEKVFLDTGVKLPMMTRALLSTSRLLSHYWWAFSIGLVGLIIFLAKFIKTKIGSQAFDYIKIKSPILGGIFVKIYSARFSRTSFTLISSGVAINEIFDTVGQVVNNSFYAKDLEKISEMIKAGKPFSSSIEQCHRFPHLVSSLLKVGEKSGKIDYVLGTLAEYFEREVDRATSNLSALIEPVIMLILGIGVGLVVISVLMPIYGLVNAI